MSRGDVVLAGGAVLGGALAVVVATGIRRRFGAHRLCARTVAPRSAAGRALRARETLAPDTLERLRLAAAI